MLKRISVLVLILASFSSHAFSQQATDSLRNLLRRQTNPVAKMHIMLELGDKFQNHQPDSALRWYSAIIPKAYASPDEFQNWLGNADDGSKYYLTVAFARAGLILIQKDQLSKGEEYANMAFIMAKSIGQFQLATYSSDNAAVMFAKKGDMQKASNFFEMSLEVYRGLNDIRGVAYCLGNLGSINARLGNLYKAADYYEQLLEIQKQSSTPIETLEDLLNIAALYTQLEELEKAKNYWGKALDVSKNLNNERITIILTNLGAITYKLNLLDESLSFYEHLLSVSSQNKQAELLALNNIAIIFNNLGQKEKSIEYWEKTFELSRSSGNARIILDALINLSNLHYLQGNLDKASEYYERYISIGRQVADIATIIDSYISIAEIQERMGNHEKAREYYTETLKIYQSKNDVNGIAKANILIGKTYIKQQRYFAALEYFNANLDDSKSLLPPQIAASHQGIADIYRLQLQYPQSLERYQKALDIWLDIQENAQASVCLNAMGLINEVTGNMPSAVSNYETALRIAQSSGNREAIAAISNNLGVVYRQLGDLPKARDSYQRALAIYLEMKNDEGASYCYNNLGIIYEISGEYAKANEFYEKSLAIKQNSQDQKGLATSLMNMGNVHKFLGNHQKAEDFYNQALSISTNIFDEQGKALALGSIAALKLEVNDYQTAIDFSKRSLEIAKSIDLKTTMKEAYKQLAWAYNATAVPEWAEESHFQVITMNHDDINRNFSILSESEKEMFFKTVAEDFDRFHSFAIRRKRANPNITRDVYNNLLRNKGLLLKSSTAMRNAILSSNNPQLIENFERWIQVKQDIAQLYTVPVEQRTVNPEELEKQANNLERMLVRNSAEFSDFEKSVKQDWTSVRDGLKPGEAAIEFTQFSHSRDTVLYCALVITPESLNPEMIPLFAEKNLEKLLGSYGGNNLNYINGIYGVNTDKNTALYDLIWRPIEPFLTDVNTVFVSPSGLLHKISFAAISKGVNQYLVDSYKLHMVSTTANVAARSSFSITPETSISLIGGIAYSTHNDAKDTWKYLQGTLDEVLMIKGLLGKEILNLKVVIDTIATEQKFKRLAPVSQVLHVATHGFFFPDPQDIIQSIQAATEEGDVEFRGGSPTFGMDNFIKNQNPLMRSGLVFAGVNDYWTGAKSVKADDGVLTALEVINIDLRRNQLVVMSACETGLGEIAGSEGVYGLQRAFKMAGTNFLIMSLWQVPDKETSEFMHTFYTYLLQVKDLQEAFAKTQATMRQKYDPFFWAAFVLLE